MKTNAVKKFQFKIPVFLGLIILLAGLIAGIFFINKIRFWNLLASSEISPQLIKITNVGSSSFVVSWITSEKTTGSLSLGETTKLEGDKKNDIRDQNKGVLSLYSLHYVLADNLKPETKYYFKIISGGKVNNRLFEITTASLKVPTDNDIAQGKVLLPEGKPATGVIVYLSLANTITQSALTDQSGNWMIPVSTARTADLKNFSDYNRSAQIEEILVQGEGQTANATLSTNNDNPTPDITLGQTYNFLNQIPEISPTATPIKNQLDPASFNLPTGSGDLSKDLELKIIFPEESENINNLSPEFLGTGPTNKELDVLIESDQEIISKTTTDGKGNWNWSPSTPLSPGQHKITVFYADKQGFIKKVSHSFIVLAAGESDLPSYTATPSGKRTTPTLSPTPTKKTIVTPSPSPSIRIAPTSSLSPTASPTVAGGITTTPVPTSRLTLTPTLSATIQPTISPVSGTDFPTQLFVGAGIATLIIGAALILF